MRSRSFCLSVLASAAFATNVLSAEQETALWKTVGAWDVYIDSTMQFQCFIATVYEDSTIFRVGFQEPGANAALYVALGNLNWASLEEGKDYDLILQIDNEASWTSPARAIKFGTMPALVISTSQVDFVEQLMRKHSLQVWFKGQQILNLSLKGSNAALNEMAACQTAVDAYVRGNRQANPKDPFSGVETVKKKDPFAY